MAKFKPGQRIVCVRKGGNSWSGLDNFGKRFSSIGPAFNEIVTVHSNAQLHKGCIVLLEYMITPQEHTLPQCFAEKNFEPLAEITELEEILNTELASV